MAPPAGLLLAACALCLPAQDGPIVPARRTDPRASVVRVHAEDGDAQAGDFHQGRQGSGVVIAPGRVATNAHVVAGHRSLSVQQQGRRWRATVASLDPARDLCLLAVPGLPLPPAQPSSPAARAAGLAVQAVGYPRGFPRTSRGTLTAIWHTDRGDVLQADALTEPGSSGGGLFDLEGRFLGLTTTVFERSSRISFSRAAETLDDLRPGEDAAGGLPPTDLVPELLQSIAARPDNQPAWEAFTRSWVRLSPEDPDAWYALGGALHMRLRRGAAGTRALSLDEALWAQAVDAFRRSTALRPGMSQAWNNLGAALELNNRFEEAEAALGTAVRLAPDYVLAWENLGTTRFNARKFGAAAAAYRTALNYRPFSGELWWGLGLCESLQDRPKDALPCLEKALTFLPRQPQLWADLARQSARAGDPTASARALARLRELDPGLEGDVARELRKR